ncbi:MAG: CPBP family intramembrane metalloprotease [Actinomyces sp.]|uniref:CPBP family intramembrane glutamic endopeptidase n=1 Tax=Actinomyces sp. TaxID=29317 RepID=UPI0026DD601A|nr:CPBP family intramembrane glutamic endopeptidase [Actinomyces sp.]MDO4243538.1 CPBP family intramembrane metalloprotease [Actinomyces sp.]
MEGIPEPEPATSGTATRASHHSLSGTRPIGWWALPPVLGLFAALWGPAVFRAVRLRLGLSPGQPPPAQSASDLEVVVTAAAVLVLAAAYRWLRGPFSVTLTSWHRTAVSTGWQACAYMLFTNLGFVTGALLAETGWLTRLPVVGEEISFPVVEPRLADLLDMTLAGPLEELALVGIPLLLFGRGRGLIAFCAVLVALRVSFHVYYGISTTVGLILWAGVALWMYLSTGRILPLVLGHSVNNLLSFLVLDALPGSAFSTTFKVVKAVLLGVGAVCTLWALRRRRSC